MKRILFALFGLVLAACGGNATTVEVTREVPVTVEVTREVPVTVEVTRVVPVTVEVTVEVTRIAEATRQPANTPTPSASSQTGGQFAKYVSGDAMQAFDVAGLEIGSVEGMTEPSDFGLAPFLTTNAIHFTIPSLCPDCGARVFAFDNPEDLQTMQNYYESLGDVSAAFASWVFVKDNLLVQLNGELPEERAREYEAALQALK